MYRAVGVVIAIAVMSSAVFGEFLHAITPHDHAHDTSLSEAQFHAALRAAEKYVSLTTFAVLFSYGLAAFFVASKLQPRPVRPPTAHEMLLMRGISKHRRFG